MRKSDPLIPPLPASEKDWLHPFLIRAQMSVLNLPCRHVCVFGFGVSRFSFFTANDVCDVCMNKIICERRILIYDICYDLMRGFMRRNFPVTILCAMCYLAWHSLHALCLNALSQSCGPNVVCGCSRCPLV